jgi:hypothetical protein
MLRTSHTERSLVSSAKRLAPGVVLAASFALVGCSGTAEADVTTEGQVAYACALADHALEQHGTADSWEAIIGHHTDPGARETASVGMLVYESEDEAFAEAGANLIDAINRVNIEGLTSGLADFQAVCDDSDISPAGDVSHAGQVDYACTLVNRVTEEYGASAEWLDEDEPAAWGEVAGAAALVGAANGQVSIDHPELSETGVDLLTTLQYNKPDDLDTSLKEFQAVCADREHSS